MSEKAFERPSSEIEALCSASMEEAEASPRKTLAHCNHFVVAKAAELAARKGLKALLPQLVDAAWRFFENTLKNDPQCWAKNAIV